MTCDDYPTAAPYKDERSAETNESEMIYERP